MLYFPLTHTLSHLHTGSFIHTLTPSAVWLHLAWLLIHSSILQRSYLYPREASTVTIHQIKHSSYRASFFFFSKFKPELDQSHASEQSVIKTFKIITVKMFMNVKFVPRWFKLTGTNMAAVGSRGDDMALVQAALCSNHLKHSLWQVSTVSEQTDTFFFFLNAPKARRPPSGPPASVWSTADGLRLINKSESFTSQIPRSRRIFSPKQVHDDDDDDDNNNNNNNNRSHSIACGIKKRVA